MGNLTPTYNFEQLATVMQTTLQQGTLLTPYLESRNVIICHPKDRDTIPSFKDYLIRLYSADSGFVVKIPRIGKYYKNIYSMGIECWLKSFSSTPNRILSGNIQQNKGIWEFFQDISDTLEHNTFNNALDPYPGSNIQPPAVLKSDEQQIEGIGFVWMGCQYNLK